jgi:C1A family cysteine protease
MQKCFCLKLVMLMILLGFTNTILIGQTRLKTNEKFYTNREKNAPAFIKQHLDSLRVEIKKNNYTFKVGYTAAADYKFEQLCGAKIPENVEALSQEQGIKNEKYFKVEADAKKEFLKLNPRKAIDIEKLQLNCFANSSAFDWISKHCVTPVRNQLSCGSCWIFGTIGAFEGSWAINHFNHPLIDASEQYLLNCARTCYVAGCTSGGHLYCSCEGGWPNIAAQFLMDKGTTKESVVPYIHAVGTCVTKTTSYQAGAWNYVAGTTPSVSQLKQALCTYGPLSITLKAGTYAFQHYTSGVFNEHNPSNPDHCVTLVGWNDNALGTGTGAWLIKNSWGTNWGMSGYMWIAYNSNSVGKYAIWVKAKPGWWPIPWPFPFHDITLPR